MKRSFTGITLVAFPLLTVLTPLARADAPNPPPVPKEAIAACASLQAGDACTVTLGGNTLDGTCAKTPDDVLACRPSRPPGPPHEAIEACASLQAGDACTVKLGDREMKGTCASAGNDVLACRPEGPPPGSR
jgi:hypothetical protein